MAVGSLGRRLRLLTLGLTAAFTVTALLAVARLRVLEGSVTTVLSRNYRSIEAAEGMRGAVAALQLAVRDGPCGSACAALEAEFGRWLAVEHDVRARAGGASAPGGRRRRRAPRRPRCARRPEQERDVRRRPAHAHARE